MKKLFKNVLLAIFLLKATYIFAQVQTATGIGYGLTKDAAVEQLKIFLDRIVSKSIDEEE